MKSITLSAELVGIATAEELIDFLTTSLLPLWGLSRPDQNVRIMW